MQTELHEKLIRLACVNGGWIPSNKSWRDVFLAKLKDPRWIDDAPEMLEALETMHLRPDAWRMSIDDEEDILLLEFLEVEVSHHISETKKNIYHRFWWEVDGSDGIRLQIWRMDRFGIMSEFMTEGTVHTFDNRLL